MAGRTPARCRGGPRPAPPRHRWTRRWPVSTPSTRPGTGRGIASRGACGGAPRPTAPPSGALFQQAVVGYALVIIVGGIVGTAVARVAVLRAGIGSLITGMQTMPSVLWYPLAFMVFGQNAKAIVLMMVLGAAPAVANGFISGIDQVPPVLLPAGRRLGARGLD